MSRKEIETALNTLTKHARDLEHAIDTLIMAHQIRRDKLIADVMPFESRQQRVLMVVLRSLTCFDSK